jgi:peptidylprolyl isomerase
MRRPLSFTSFALIPLVALALTGCTQGGAGPTASPTTTTGESGACATPAAGAESSSVKVTGSLDSPPKVSFAKGLSVTSTQRSTVIQGHGAKAVPNTLLDVAFTIYDASSGAKISAAGYRGTPAAQFTVSDKLFLPGLVKAMQCATIGSRTVTVADAADMFGSNGSETFHVKAGDDLVIVLDLLSPVAKKADGDPVTPKAGFPAVTLASDGEPTVTIPKKTAPSTFETEVLKKGAGAVVPSGASVTIQYQGTLWRTGKVFDQSWGSGPTTFSLGQVVPGFKKAIVGQTVGSQVVVIVPPADGYGASGNDTAGIKGTDTLVFVIDILAKS